MIGWLLRYLVLMSLLLPGVVYAKAVAALVDAAGERVAILEFPPPGAIPGRIHRLYCAGPATLSAIYESTLTPNGIKSDKFMPAEKLLAVHCVELRRAWKKMSLPEFAAHPSKALEEAKAAAEQANAALASAKADLGKAQVALVAVKAELVRSAAEVKRLEAEIHAVPPPPSWWQNPLLWIVGLLVLLLLAMFVLLLRVRRSKQALESERTRLSLAAKSPTDGGIWVLPTSGEAIRLWIAVWDEALRGLRLFQYSATKQPDKSYCDVAMTPWFDVGRLGNAMHATLSRYCGDAMGRRTYPFNVEQVEQAKLVGSLVEMPIV